MNRRVIGVVTAAATLLSLLFGGCGAAQSQEVRMDLSGPVNSLDPQFVTDPVGRMLVQNTFTGLMRRDNGGQLVCAGAESYTVSGDGLRYTFVLRKDMGWSNGDPVVAADYHFALTRLFNSQVPSPYAGEYLSIQNAAQVLAGTLPQSALGVRAPDDYTLEITLGQPSPVFLERLAEPAAMPCQEEFFASTRARYGLAKEYTIFSGPYQVRQWNNDKSLVLSPNQHYPEEQRPACPSVVLYTTRLTGEDTGPDTQLQLFVQDKSDVCPVTAQQLETVTAEGVTSFQLENRVWQLAVNTAHSSLQNLSLRRGLFHSLDSGGYRERAPAMYGLAESIIPQSAQMEGLVAPDLPAYNRQWAVDYWNDGMAQLETDKITGLTLLLPQEAKLETLGAYLQRQWRDNLGVYVNLESVDGVTFERRLRSGDYTLALRPGDGVGQGPSGLLDRFLADSADNLSGWSSPDYDLLLEQAAQAVTPREAARLYSQAEQLLIDNGVVLPILTQSSYYLFSKGTSGVTLAGGRLDFSKAFRID